MSESNENKTYQQSWELPHPPEKVWRALTDSNLLTKWIMSNDMKPVVGHKFTFRAEPTPWWDGIVYCEVLEIEPIKRIRYSWQGAKNSSGAFGVDTVVTWTLKATSSGTLLSIEQSGFSPTSTQAYKGAKMGWERNIETLHQLLGEAQERGLQ
jgi:uncharacterized protein YndB with AHSA1/START domain